MGGMPAVMGGMPAPAPISGGDMGGMPGGDMGGMLELTPHRARR